ncbi:MAG: hypothetical protein U0176_06310 [Bacteroidia bacterium]
MKYSRLQGAKFDFSHEVLDAFRLFGNMLCHLWPVKERLILLSKWKSSQGRNSVKEVGMPEVGTEIILDRGLMKITIINPSSKSQIFKIVDEQKGRRRERCDCL